MPHREHRWGKPLSEEKRRHEADVFFLQQACQGTRAIQFNQLLKNRCSGDNTERHSLVHRGTNKARERFAQRAFLPRTVEKNVSTRRTSPSTSAPGSSSGPKRRQRDA